MREVPNRPTELPSKLVQLSTIVPLLETLRSECAARKSFPQLSPLLTLDRIIPRSSSTAMIDGTMCIAIYSIIEEGALTPALYLRRIGSVRGLALQVLKRSVY